MQDKTSDRLEADKDLRPLLLFLVHDSTGHEDLIPFFGDSFEP